MPRSERAAGLVPFIVMLVLFLAALGWGYGNYSDLDTAEADRKRLAERAKNLEEQLVDLRTDMEALGDRVGARDGEALRGDIERFITGFRELTEVRFTDTELDIPDPAADENQIRRGADGNVVVHYFEGGKPADTYTTTEMFEPIRLAFERMKRDLQAYDQRNKTLREERAAMEAAHREELSAKDAEFQTQVAALESDKARLEADIDRETREKAQATSDRDQARAVAETARAEAKAAQDEARMAILTMQEEVKRKNKAIELVRNEEPDGEVLASSMSTGIVMIDRGRQHNLKPGTVFQVYTHGKGGVRVMKGVIRVLSSEDETAKCGLVSGGDIVQGDKIFNRLYHPKKSLRIAVIGRMTKYGTSQAKTILEKLGNTIDEKVSMHTDYLLVGAPEEGSDDITTTDDYREALRFGVQIITERDLELFTLY